MLHPSYGELIEKVNEVNKEKNLDPVNSRYSIVIAAARRARDLVEGDKLMVDEKNPEISALSRVVDEMDAGKLAITYDKDREEERMLQYENLSVVDFSRDMEEEE